MKFLGVPVPVPAPRDGDGMSLVFVAYHCGFFICGTSLGDSPPPDSVTSKPSHTSPVYFTISSHSSINESSKSIQQTFNY